MRSEELLEGPLSFCCSSANWVLRVEPLLSAEQRKRLVVLGLVRSFVHMGKKLSGSRMVKVTCSLARRLSDFARRVWLPVRMLVSKTNQPPAGTQEPRTISPQQVFFCRAASSAYSVANCKAQQ